MDLHVLEARIKMDKAALDLELATAIHTSLAHGNSATTSAKTEEAKPTAKEKQKAAGAKAKADQAKVQKAADEAQAKKPPFDEPTKTTDVAAATGYKEGAVNVFGNGLVNLRHLSPEDRAPYMAGVELKNYNHATAEKEGVMAPDLVAEAIAGLGTKAPVGEYGAEQYKAEGDAVKTQFAAIAKIISSELAMHMLGRTDRATFGKNAAAIKKAMEA